MARRTDTAAARGLAMRPSPLLPALIRLPPGGAECYNGCRAFSLIHSLWPVAPSLFAAEIVLLPAVRPFCPLWCPLLGRWGNGRRVMIHDHPVPVALHVGKTIPRGKRLGLAILQEREGVIACIDGSISIDPYVLSPNVTLWPGRALNALTK